MPVKKLVRCAPILPDDTVPRVIGFVAGVFGHAPAFDIGLVFVVFVFEPHVLAARN
jgi:hypothetical protein